jgi:hypothetical protein
MNRLVGYCLVFIAFGAGTASAQGVDRVAIGFGVDTTSAAWSDVEWHGAVAEIFREWSSYLREGRNSEAGREYWTADERSWPMYDVAATIGTYNAGFAATVLDIRPASPDVTDEFVVKTLIARVVGTEQDVRPVALTRVYAVQENGRWVFANALTRDTSDWSRTTVGPITYVVSPSRSFDRGRAERLLAFADSVSESFGVPGLPPLTYYVADSSDEIHRAMGVEWTFGSFGSAYGSAGNSMILSGNPVFGEENRHEVMHLLLGPIVAAGRTPPMIQEGVASWLGGSQEMTFEQFMRRYATYLRQNPDVTVDTVLSGSSVDRGYYPTGALLVSMVYARGRFPAVRELLTSGPSADEMRAAVSRLLGMEWAQVVAEVRRRTLEFG